MSPSLRRVLATAGMMIAVLMCSLDSTIANVALPHMQASLSASHDQMTWVLTAYILGQAIMTPFSGWLSAKIGLKQLFVISVASFIIVSILCGVATSLPEMVVLRLLQGITGASVVPLSQAAIFGMWPRERMPQVIAIWSAVAMAAPIMGPTLGGYLTEVFTWRSVFYINLPVGLLAFALIALALERDPGGQERPFDSLGFTALVMFTCAAQLMLDRGPSQDWFSSPEIVIEALIAACGLWVFVFQTVTARSPFFHRALFRDRNFMTAVGFQMSGAAVGLAVTALLPTMMQQLLGYSAMQSGTASMSRGVGSLLGYMFAPWIAKRFGARPAVIGGVAVMSASLYFMSGFDLMMTSSLIEWTGLFLGFGQSLMFNPIAVLAYVTLLPEHRTEGTVFSTMFRTLGGSIGIALMQAGLTHQSAVANEAITSTLSPVDVVDRWAAPSLLGGQSDLLAISGEVTRQALMVAYNSMFAWMCLASLILIPLTLLLRAGSGPPATTPAVHAD